MFSKSIQLEEYFAFSKYMALKNYLLPRIQHSTMVGQYQADGVVFEIFRQSMDIGECFIFTNNSRHGVQATF